MTNKKYAYPAVILSAIFGATVFFYLSGIYLPITDQFIVSWGLLIPLIFIRQRQNISNKMLVRTLFLLIASFISIRYWFWRTTGTLFYLGLFDFIGALILYSAESYSLLVHLLGIFVNIWPLKRAPVPLPSDVDLPTVDILIPTYTEPEDIVRITAMASTQIDYPKEKLNIYILDDGATEARRKDLKICKLAWARHRNLNALAEQLGIHYITRERNERAKAGNINNALKHTSGELILILDCDHVPSRDILKNTVGLFLRDKKLFLVQTPHFFINPNPVEKNLATFEQAPMENEMFFSSILLGLDFWNSAFFCGSAAVLRRNYLEEVGGISGETITEDAETALDLHAKGYNSAFVSRPMSCGLSPETFSDFILQRSRWSQGMTQIFMLKNPLLKKGLSIYQRLCYTNSCLFWFFGFTRIAFYLAPMAFIFFGLKIYNASVEQVLAYAIPHVIATVMVTDYLYGRVRWSFFSELYESVQSLFILPAVVSVFLNPRSPSFKITPKGTSIVRSSLSSLAKPFYILLLLIAISLPVAAIKWYTEPAYRDVIAICSAWSIYNLVIVLACLGVVWEKKHIRKFHRLPIKMPAKIYFPRINYSVDANIKDLSLGGARVEFAGETGGLNIRLGEDVLIDLKDSYGEEYKFKCSVVHTYSKQEKSEIGIEYELLEDKETFADLVKFFYGDSNRWSELREARLQNIGIWEGLIFFIRKGLKGGLENFKGIADSSLMPNIKNMLSVKFNKSLQKTQIEG